MPVDGIKQTNLFGGEDDILDDVDLREKELREGDYRKITITLKAKVPDATIEELSDWVHFELMGGELRGIMTRFNDELDITNINWEYNDK